LIRAPRSTRAALAEAEAAQAAVIAALRAACEDDIADRLLRCQMARSARRGSEWPWRCRSAGCWACRRPAIHRWWSELCQWVAASGTPVSFCKLPLRAGRGLRAAVRHIRKACRDLRDRAARGPGGRRWQAIAIAGLALGDGTAWLAVAHGGITRTALADGFARRFGAVVFADLADTPPPTSFSDAAAVELSRLGRGVEPLRVAVAPQRAPAVGIDTSSGAADPMPILVG
jgi:hypothetical protein